ncbi:MAG: hypothetical protein ACRCVG_04475 [Methanobacteriaceae archaeon]
MANKASKDIMSLIEKTIETIKLIPSIVLILTTEAIIKLIMYIIIGLFWIVRRIVNGIILIVRILVAILLSTIIKIIIVIKKKTSAK